MDHDNSVLTINQRGKTRSVDGDRDGTNRCDIGAFEYSPAPAGGGGDHGGFCFIATAAYGSYLHPHVQSLRNFTDEYLLSNALDRALVQWYYERSPPLADRIAADTHLRIVVRGLLTPVVYGVAYPRLAFTVTLVLFISLVSVMVRKAQRKNSFQAQH